MYRYIEHHDYKYIHNLPQFVSTLNSRLNRTVGIRPNKVNISDFMSVLHAQHLRKLRRPQFRTGDKVRNSKIGLPFRKGCKPEFTEEVFQIVAIASKKTSNVHLRNEQRLIIRGEFYEKELIRVISRCNRLQ